MNEIKWKIGRSGRAWEGEEAIERHNILPEPSKIEMHKGKLLWSDEERLTVVAMLLENLGLDKVMPILDPDLLFEAMVVHEIGEDKLKKILEDIEQLKKLKED